MDLFDTFTRHSSVRDFQPRPLSKELKQKLVTVAQSGSSSNFVQAYSIIEVSDPENWLPSKKLPVPQITLLERASSIFLSPTYISISSC